MPPMKSGFVADEGDRVLQVGDEPLGDARLGVPQRRTDVDSRRTLQSGEAPAAGRHLVEHLVHVEPIATST